MDPKKIVLLNLVYPGGHLASSRHGRANTMYYMMPFFGILAILPVDTKFRSTTVVNLVHSSTDFLSLHAYVQ